VSAFIRWSYKEHVLTMYTICEKSHRLCTLQLIKADARSVYLSSGSSTGNAELGNGRSLGGMLCHPSPMYAWQ
jgi:hypothetical protein